MLSGESAREERDRRLNGSTAMAVFALAVGLTGCPRDWGVIPDAGDEPDAAQSGTACGSRGLPECAEDEYCAWPVRANCGAADMAGVCKGRPEICDDIYAPVCGCDGKTYPNDCTAAASGVSVASPGQCGGSHDAGAPDDRACGGLQGLQCEDGEYCNFAPDPFCGAADQTGVCAKRPRACTRIYAPVCGCDGKTYGNDCEAAAAGVSIVSQGECGASDGGMSGQACGGLRGLQCAGGEFCNFPLDAFCGAADATGICEPKPDLCTEQYAPVCGCDGETYGNACAANAAGVSVASKGECGGAPDARACGGLQGLQCEDGEYCNFAPDPFCGAADATGICEPKPDVCTEQYAPVCGCDGETYGNACMAAAAGISVTSNGECGGDNQSCGGLLGWSCGDGQYCNFAKDALCGAADQTGICTDIPQACTKELNPVCGCDDHTYNNPCLAAAAGVSVRAQGACDSGSGSGAFCGGIAGVQCEAKSEYCNFPDSTNCGSGDQGGTCQRIPDVCTLEFNPVCGCDGMTYPNRCAAAAAGVSVQATGECK